MKSAEVLAAIICLFLIVPLGYADTINVPADYATIQAALDASIPGDEIIVAPNTYKENLVTPGHNLVIRSATPDDWDIVQSTVIDGNAKGPVVVLKGSETEDFVLSGFSIINGRSTANGGGISGNGALATIRNCSVRLNQALNSGGGIAGCDGLITNCRFLGNRGSAVYACDGHIASCTFDGEDADSVAGIADCDGEITECLFKNIVETVIIHCDGTIRNNRILDCSAFLAIRDCEARFESNELDNVGFFTFGVCNATFISNTIRSSENAFNQCEGLFDGNFIDDCEIGFAGCSGSFFNNIVINGNNGFSGGDGVVANNIIYGNRGPAIEGTQGTIINNILWANNQGGDQTANLFNPPSYSCIQNYTGPGTGNITSNPLLDTNNGYRPLPASPCIDAGGFIASVTQDFEGNSRPYQRTEIPGGDGSAFDIGAYELDSPYVTVQAVPAAGIVPLSGEIIGSATTYQGYFTRMRWYIDGDLAADWPVSDVTQTEVNTVYSITEEKNETHRFEVVDDRDKVFGAQVVIQASEPTPVPSNTPTPTQTPTEIPTITPTPTPKTTVEIIPETQTIHPAAIGETTTSVDILVSGAADLAAYDLDMYFSGSIIGVDSIDDVTFGDFLGSAGGSVFEFGPIISNDYGRLRLGEALLSGPAPSGDGNLARIVFTVRPVTRRSEAAIVIADPGLTDGTGEPIPSRLSPARVTVCFYADVNCDNQVDITDLQIVAGKWGASVNETPYSSACDLNRDDEIDIQDIQLVAARWHQFAPFEP